MESVNESIERCLSVLENKLSNHQEVYLVTGASGFVGGYLVRRLLDQGIRVRAMVRNENNAQDLKGLGAEVVKAELRDAESLARAVVGVRGVYHIAALFRQHGFADRVFREVNADGTRLLLDASIHAGVRRFIHCSTVGVLGDIAHLPADESTPYGPCDIYQQTKMEGEKLALEAFQSGRISGVVIRPAMIYGPGDQRTLKLFRMIARRRFFYVGRGLASVHWIDVRDLVRAFQLAMDHQERNGEIYIIAGQSPMPLRTMCEEVAGQLGVSPPWLTLPVRPIQWAGSLCEALCRPFGVEPPLYRRRVDFYTKHRSFDGSKAGRELGFKPSGTFREEVANIIISYQEKRML